MRSLRHGKIVVDSSVWLESLLKGPLIDQCSPYLKEMMIILTPSVVVFEVFRKAIRVRGKELGRELIVHLNSTEIIPLSGPLAMTAATLSVEHRLATVDAIIYATATSRGCPLITLDPHFEHLDGVTLLK